ncbi:exodeoxyribonuclease VII small subunit [Cellulomonas sp. S1-8]|uniref:exodeoxyribonuclease VII small subunit n=1 Tax=Cellulomonas sp. S1-8 TaxID=2904790 RepID=UPI0022434FC1|nr:exodeoxyribonuclease VII small subunit [Cellulomonas sp. S1-8]UZN05260.1 exodeoxyribonuclease VII small subunit [Cellulomonas sp. S1-8]
MPDPAALGYEQARDELVSIVARLESGTGTLEESLALWERGEALAARCQQWLDGARARLTAARGGPAADDGGPDLSEEPAGSPDEEEER